MRAQPTSLLKREKLPGKKMLSNLDDHQKPLTKSPIKPLIKPPLQLISKTPQTPKVPKIPRILLILEIPKTHSLNISKNLKKRKIPDWIVLLQIQSIPILERLKTKTAAPMKLPKTQMPGLPKRRSLKIPKNLN